MPHLTIQMTPNVEVPSEASLLKALNSALWNSGHFAKPTDIKARIIPLDRFLVGVDDDEQTYGFIYAHLKLMMGRDITERNRLAEIIVTVIDRELSTVQSERTTVQIAVEVEEISAVYHKKILGD